MKKSAVLYLLILLSGAIAYGLQIGDPAPQFSAHDQDGKEIHLSDFKNQFLLVSDSRERPQSIRTNART